MGLTPYTGGVWVVSILGSGAACIVGSALAWLQKPTLRLEWCTSWAAGASTPMPAWLGGWLQCNHCKRGVVGFGLRSAGFWEGWTFGLPPDPNPCMTQRSCCLQLQLLFERWVHQLGSCQLCEKLPEVGSRCQPTHACMAGWLAAVQPLQKRRPGVPWFPPSCWPSPSSHSPEAWQAASWSSWRSTTRHAKLQPPSPVTRYLSDKPFWDAIWKALWVKPIDSADLSMEYVFLLIHILNR